MQKNSKKGAIELGMNTIIIVVIGITLLSLALVWIRGMMGEEGIGGLTKTAFGQAEGAVSDIYQGSSEELTVVPETVKLAQGKTTRVKVRLNNMEETDFSDVKFETEISKDEGQLVTCRVIGSSGPYTVKSGKSLAVDIELKVSPDSNLGTAYCIVSVPDVVDSQKTIQIDIVS